MKARCRHCGCTIAPRGPDEAGSEVVCPDCGALLDLESNQECKYAKIHVTEEVESFVVEWQL
jgi:acetone carboxylase gamma subunit